MNDPYCDVLVSADGGQTWRRYPGCPGSPAKAIEHLRDEYPDLKANDDALYFASSAFKMRRFEKEMIASYSLVEVTPEEVAALGAKAGTDG